MGLSQGGRRGQWAVSGRGEADMEPSAKQRAMFGRGRQQPYLGIGRWPAVPFDLSLDCPMVTFAPSDTLPVILHFTFILYALLLQVLPGSVNLVPGRCVESSIFIIDGAPRTEWCLFSPRSNDS